MPKSSQQTIQQRHERIFHLLQQHPDGLRTAEIAERLNLHRKMVDRDLAELEAKYRVGKENMDWYAFPSQHVMPRPLSLEAEEAVMLYLAARLLVKQSDKRNTLGEDVLLKLATSVSEDVGLTEDIQAAAQELAHRPEDEQYGKFFQTVITAYVYRHPLRITYRPYQGKAFETVFETYLLEPSAIGYATYAIGYSQVVDDLRTYKIGRIVSAEMIRREEYRIPEDFPGLQILRNAWSIFWGNDLTRVVMRFHPDVARRVRETYWHPSQQLADDPETPGHLRMAVEVADLTDIKPWIRGWGANCEVLEPAQLRDELTGEARRLAELYGWYTTRNPASDEDDPLGLDDTFSDYFG